MKEALSRPPPPSPGLRVSYVRDHRGPPAIGVGYGPIAPALGCSLCTGYSYGFGYGRFPPHSHFFPNRASLRRGTRLFFPDGHMSHRGFLVGHGYFAY